MGRLCLGDWLDCLLGAESNVSFVTPPPSGAQAGKMPTCGGLLMMMMMLSAAAVMLPLVDSRARIWEGANPQTLHPKSQTFNLYR